MPDPRIFPISTVTDTGVIIGGASVLALATNDKRSEADFTNDGAGIIYLGRGHAAVIGHGQRLNPQGGSYHIGLHNLFPGEIYAISTVADTNLSISEGQARP